MTDTHGQHNQDERCTRVGLHNCGGQWRNHDRWPFHDQGERRTAQIAAVRRVLGGILCEDPDQLAAELVDAVLAAGGLCGETTESMLLDHPPMVCTMPAGHAGRWHGDDTGCRWTRNEPTPDALDQAGAAGYAAAVANLRDDQKHRPWWIANRDSERYWSQMHRLNLADYLEAVGPQKDQKLTEEDWRQAAELADEALRDEWSDQKLTEERPEFAWIDQVAAACPRRRPLRGRYAPVLVDLVSAWTP